MKISDLFDIKYGVNLELINCEIANDDDFVNFVSRTSTNNGVVAKVKRIDGVEPHPAGVLTCAAGGSVLSTFVQTKPFYSGRDLFILTPKIDMTLNEKLFYCMCIQENAYRYGYGRQANKTLKDIEIVSSIPEWVNSKKIEPIKTNINKKINKIDTNNWKEFKYKDVFSINRGESKYLKNMNLGIYPYISASSANNGVSGYVDEYNNCGNKITLSYDGTVCEAFYQGNKFFASEKIVVIDLLEGNLNKYIAMFLITLIKLEKYRFSYGYKWTVEYKMKEHKIKLPVNKKGKPDYEFMEKYIKNFLYSDII